MNFLHFASTANGDGEMYYSAPQDVGSGNTEREAVVVTRLAEETKVTNSFPPQFSKLKLGAFTTLVALDRFKCEERKVSPLKIEFYDVSNRLLHLITTDPSKPPVWNDFQQDAPVAVLQRILCTPQKVEQ
jgi:hypothetical protein